MQKIIFLLLLTLNLFSQTLSPIYFVHSNSIKLQDIIPSATYNVLLYKIDRNRYSKKIKSKNLMKLLATHGFTSLDTSSRYIKFIKKSPIDLTYIRNSITKAYEEKFPAIDIKSIRIIPRGYIKKLPLKYEVIMQKKYFLSKKGIFSIKALDNKKIFFDYLIDAKIMVYLTKNQLRKSMRISTLNTRKKVIQLDKLRALPITIEQLNITQSKRNIKAQTILTHRDIQTLHLVKKGSNVIVNLDNNNITISFWAKALQSGKLHDIITVQKSNKKRLRVQITGKNQVSIK